MCFNSIAVRFKPPMVLLLLWLGIALVGAGCASTSSDDAPAPLENEVSAERTGHWTPTELTNELGGEDPIEGFNRSMFCVTDFVMVWIADPLGRVYTTILPRPFIEHLDNVCKNLEFPAHAISNLGRAEWLYAWDDTARFLLNTTVGIVGIFDPAANWFDIYPTESDFGLMFNAWGIGSGCTFVLPIIPSTNIRDTVGSIFDMLFDIKTYIPYAGLATILNRMTIAESGYSELMSGCADPYKTFRESMLVRRELQRRMWFYQAKNLAAEQKKKQKVQAENDGEELSQNTPEIAQASADASVQRPEWVTGEWLEINGYQSQSPMLDTVRVARFNAQHNHDPWYMRLSLFNSDFSNKCKICKIKLVPDPDAPVLKFGFWKAPDPEKDQQGKPVPRLEKLAIILPGIGGNFWGMTSTALAELLYEDGYAVLSLDSPFAWQFMVANGNQKLPGYLPDDAACIRSTLGMILKKLTDEQMIHDPRIVMIGCSMGGLETLKISALEENDGTLGIQRYLAINPPVELSHAVDQADALNQAGSEWTSAEAIDQLSDAMGKAMLVMSRVSPPYDPDNLGNPPFNYGYDATSDQVDYVASIYFKSCLRDILLLAHKERGLTAFQTEYRWGKRNALYGEIDKVDFHTYAEKFLAPEHSQLPLSELYRQSGMRSFAESLKRNPKVRVIHSIDDFLLTDDDRRWLDAILGNRLIWFNHGSHLGNLYTIPVQRQILNNL